jgi:hypothetical protein
MAQSNAYHEIVSDECRGSKFEGTLFPAAIRIGNELFSMWLTTQDGEPCRYDDWSPRPMRTDLDQFMNNLAAKQNKCG